MVRIAPSILSADFAQLGAEVQALSKAGADAIHVDVMDGHYVPNLTLGPDIVRALRPHTTLPLDVHLMISPADPLIEAFASAGANRLTVHPDAGPHLHRTLQLIKSCGAAAGVALNPAVGLDALDYVLGEIDQVLLMTVNPGFGGQAFIPEQLEKIRKLRERLSHENLTTDIAVDGGVTADNAEEIIQAGASVLVAGTAVFKDGPAQYQKHIAALREKPWEKP